MAQDIFNLDSFQSSYMWTDNNNPVQTTHTEDELTSFQNITQLKTTKDGKSLRQVIDPRFDHLLARSSPKVTPSQNNGSAQKIFDLHSSTNVSSENMRHPLNQNYLTNLSAHTQNKSIMKTSKEKRNSQNIQHNQAKLWIYLLICILYMALIAIPIGLLFGLPKQSTTSTTEDTITTTDPVCTPFWQMPAADQGTNMTYSNVNTLISGDSSRSGCATFRANVTNVDDIIFDIGSLSGGSGCNRHFALSIIDASHITVYGMCTPYDNHNIALSQSTLYDGSFHQICVTYDNTTTELCVYQDLQSAQCLIRTNARYNTGSGDLCIGWWPDLNRPFIASGGGLIKWVSLFNTAINKSCVTYLYQLNNVG